MRRAPLLTVFNESTAALDAPTEHARFERVAAGGVYAELYELQAARYR